MKHNYLLTGLAISIGVIIISILYAYTVNAPSPKISFSSNYNQYQEYTASYINSSSQYDIGEIVYPAITTPLNSSSYWIALVKEQLDLFNNKFDDSFFATKRINELKLWGNDIPVKRTISISRSNTYISLLKHWKTEKKDYNSWEASLARYAVLMEQLLRERIAMSSDVRSDALTELKRQIIVDRETIETTVATISKSPQDKEYLTNLSNSVFDTLINRISAYIPEFDASTVLYPLPQLQQDKEYGLYDVETEFPPDLATDSAIVQTTHGSFHVKYSDRLSFSGNKIASFANIPLDAADKTILLKLPKTNLLESAPWENTESKEANYTYTIPVPQLPVPRRYLLEVTYDTKISLDFEYLQKIEVGDSTTSVVRDVRASLLPVRGSTIFRRSLDYNSRTKYIDNAIYLRSPIPLTEEQLSHVQVLLRPVLTPDIRLTKKERLPGKNPTIESQKLSRNIYSLTVQNTTRNEEQTIVSTLDNKWLIFSSKGHMLILYRPYILSLITIVLGLFMTCVCSCVIFFYEHIQRTFASSYVILRELKNHPVSFIVLICNRFRYNLLAIAVLFFFVDIFVIATQIDAITYPLLLLWVMVIVGFRINYKTNFVLAICFLVLSLLLITIDAPNMANKAGLWTYMMIVVGFFQALWWHHLNDNEQMGHTDFLKHIIHSLVQSVGIPVWKVVTVVYAHILPKIQAYFKSRLRQHPRTTADYTYNFAVIFTHIAVALFVIALFIYSSLSLYRLYKLKKHQLLRISLNPHISSIEPKIVYRTTKVLLIGTGFDWKDTVHYKLMSTYGQIQTDYWGNPKIIFTVPIDWKPGTVSIWVEKSILWDGQTITASSSAVQLKLIPTHSTFTPEDDAFFEQLKHMSPEVLKLNHY